ncbi:hypothetical protein chiPu_0001731 [Chiloscyllium punctatum]|uniref:Protein MANBAL n=1 Tax=Chiloscyllium punctatum TaxID=137246 RepID=A0A401RYU9_CHIPU|nr:hypothetical protein [Chiloscyllium punctatum]
MNGWGYTQCDKKNSIRNNCEARPERQTIIQDHSRRMASEFDLSPPEIPEPTFFDNVLRYGLFLGAIFQIICILSILLPSSKSSEPEWEKSESKPLDTSKKQKPPTPSSGKKAKKESKKKR